MHRAHKVSRVKRGQDFVGLFSASEKHLHCNWARQLRKCLCTDWIGLWVSLRRVDVFGAEFRLIWLRFDGLQFIASRRISNDMAVGHQSNKQIANARRWYYESHWLCHGKNGFRSAIPKIHFLPTACVCVCECAREFMFSRTLRMEARRNWVYRLSTLSLCQSFAHSSQCSAESESDVCMNAGQRQLSVALAAMKYSIYRCNGLRIFVCTD